VRFIPALLLLLVENVDDGEKTRELGDHEVKQWRIDIAVGVSGPLARVTEQCFDRQRFHQLARVSYTQHTSACEYHLISL
jgi:hypothetical protein